MTTAAIGAGVTLATVICLLFHYARQVARFLLSLAAAREAFRETWRAPGNPSTCVDKRRNAKAAGPQLALDHVQAETIEALAGLGMNRQTAAARVRAQGTAADVQTLLRRCMTKAAA